MPLFSIPRWNPSLGPRAACDRDPGPSLESPSQPFSVSSLAGIRRPVSNLPSQCDVSLNPISVCRVTQSHLSVMCHSVPSQYAVSLSHRSVCRVIQSHLSVNRLSQSLSPIIQSTVCHEVCQLSFRQICHTYDKSVCESNRCSIP